MPESEKKPKINQFLIRSNPSMDAEIEYLKEFYGMNRTTLMRFLIKKEVDAVVIRYQPKNQDEKN